MTDVALPLLIAVPILAAVAPLFSSVLGFRAGWYAAAVTTAIEVGLAAVVLAAVYGGDRLVHPVGGYPAPYGIELVGDGLSAPIVALIAAVSLGVVAFAYTGGPRRNSFYSAYLLLVGGLMGVSITGDLFNMFVFLEITGLATYALVAADRSDRSAVAALKYLILGTMGASFFIIGVGYAFISTGTLNMVDLSARLAGSYTARPVLASFGFMIVGLGLKAAVFPLHTWQPDAYTYASDTVTTYISALVSTVAAYAIARVILTVFTLAFFEAAPLARWAVLTFATVSVLAGGVLAVVQTEIKRMLAYSSVSQFGLVVAAFALATPDAVLGGVVHLVGHGLMKGGLFAAAAILAATHGARTVDDYARLGYRSPVVAGTLAVLGLALVGIPPSIGFLGKYYIAVGAVRAGVWPVAIVVFFSTLLTLAYVARLLERLYFADPDAAAPVPEPSPDAPVADGGETEDTDHAGPASGDGGDTRTVRAVSSGMVLVTVLAAVVVVALGFAAPVFETLVEAFLGGVFS
ncbi:monovalent cation/H+ antiporter subunit D family protein [Natronomonas sp. F2-12]|jgi:multicomponent Na+:H+ antiporter subunit D|uniref:Monovalent cation/H+ antiporter subunit D family protein n=1 Tax=Natronomonas aquatica TaxID=2841590 RepID=A0A9R1CVQ0_9EURY|nr:monovalent cation/H+ antiporter subunit D family protein [Natronomonas aquatica]MCQ4334479.1 monovalent cation/H+ antiporter subunit D family protein [Natronomonas aquatica]